MAAAGGLVALALLAAAARPTAVDTFARAKRALIVLYADHPETLYSGCTFSPAQREVDYGHCAYVPHHDTARAHRIEWEHIVPAQAFGGALPAWREGDPACVDRRQRPYRGRACAARVSAAFRRMEADMHNLVPEIGEVNAMRGNLAMAELATEPATEPSIGARFAEARFEPRAAVRGDVARAYLYMASVYRAYFMVDPPTRAMFWRWSRADPVDAWECERAERVARLQGQANPFVAAACAALANAAGQP